MRLNATQSIYETEGKILGVMFEGSFWNCGCVWSTFWAEIVLFECLYNTLSSTRHNLIHKIQSLIFIVKIKLCHVDSVKAFK